MPENWMNKATVKSEHGTDSGGWYDRAVNSPSVFDTTKQKIGRAASSFYRPALEMGGSIVGAGLATPADVAAGPTPTILGGGMGYAAGNNLADQLDTFFGIGEKQNDLISEIVEMGKDTLNGVGYEIVGQSIPAGFVGTKKGIKKITSGAINKIGSFTPKGFAKKQFMDIQSYLMAKTKFGPIYAENIKEATNLEKEIPGLKFTLAQKSNNPEIIMAERASMRMGGVNAGNMAKELEAQNNAAIDNYFKTKFGGKEGIDDVLDAINLNMETLGRNVDEAQKIAENGLYKLASGDPEKAGADIIEGLRENSAAHKKIAGELFDKVKDQPLDTSILKNTIADIENGFKPNMDLPQNYPTKIINGIKKQLQITKKQLNILNQSGQPIQVADAESGKMMFSDLRELRSTVLGELRKPDISAKLRRRLAQLQDGIESTINTIDSDNYREAAKYYKNYQQKFGSGAVGDILRRGGNGELTKFDNMDIAKKFFNFNKPQDPNRLIMALGSKKSAIKAIKEYAVYDFSRSAKTVRQGEKWLEKNKIILNKYGLYDDFANVNRLQKRASLSEEKFKQFEKSAAAKALNADPEKAINQIFSGKGAVNTRATAAKLMEDIKTPEARRGLQNSFAEFLINKAQKTFKDISGGVKINNSDLQKLIRRYKPAMKEIYKNDLDKLSSLTRVQKAIEIQIRNQSSPLGGGSDTAENIVRFGFKVIPTFVTNKLSRLNAIKTMGEKISNKYQTAANEYFLKAMFDPNEANFLVSGFRKQIPLDEFASQLKKRIVGIYTAGAISATYGDTNMRKDTKTPMMLGI